MNNQELFLKDVQRAYENNNLCTWFVDMDDTHLSHGQADPHSIINFPGTEVFQLSNKDDCGISIDFDKCMDSKTENDGESIAWKFWYSSNIVITVYFEKE